MNLYFELCKHTTTTCLEVTWFNPAIMGTPVERETEIKQGLDLLVQACNPRTLGDGYRRILSWIPTSQFCNLVRYCLKIKKFNFTGGKIEKCCYVHEAKRLLAWEECNISINFDLGFYNLQKSLCCNEQKERRQWYCIAYSKLILSISNLPRHFRVYGLVHSTCGNLQLTVFCISKLRF